MVKETVRSVILKSKNRNVTTTKSVVLKRCKYRYFIRRLKQIKNITNTLLVT